LEVRVTVPGHVQRGGQPCAYDRVLATRLGAKTAELILQKKYGYMTCVKENKIDIIPISEVAGKTKLVDMDSDIIRQAKFAGLSFGDEPCGI
jgi:6-phosphofructokinase